MIDLSARTGLDIELDTDRLALSFGPGIAHPEGERRLLADVRSLLEDPSSSGPEHLYSIYMDIARIGDLPAIRAQGLLYGAVVYNTGSIGRERLRSQGHVHSRHAGSGLRYSEAYEFWTGRAYVYLQKECAPQVTRAVLVDVGPGDKLVIPSGWVHLVVTLGDEHVSFGAWCARDASLEYDCLRALGGPAYFVRSDGSIVRNGRYRDVARLEHARPSDFPDFDIPRNRPIYTGWQREPRLFSFLPDPELARAAWDRL